MNSELFVVLTNGFCGSSDGEVAGAMGAYSSEEKAIKALTELMKAELTDMNVKLDFDNISFEELSGVWSEESSGELFSIHKVQLNDILIDMSETLIDMCEE